MKTTTKFTSAALLLALGIGTVTLFQNCSSGSTPSDLSTASAVPLPTTNPPLLMYPAATSVTAGGTVLLTVSGGSAGYRFTATGGSVTSDPLAGFIYNAPSVVGSYVITVTDSSSATYTTTMNVTAAQATTPTPVTTTSKTIYRFFNTQTSQHSFSDVQTFASNNEGPQYLLASDASAGAVPFYRCAFVPQGGRSPTTFFYDTTQATCEGYSATATQIGFIYPSASQANTQPLYRFRLEFQSAYGDQRGFAVDHIDSTNPALPAAGWIQESVLGYVPTK